MNGLREFCFTYECNCPFSGTDVEVDGLRNVARNTRVELDTEKDEVVSRIMKDHLGSVQKDMRELQENVRDLACEKCPYRNRVGK